MPMLTNPFTKANVPATASRGSRSSSAVSRRLAASPATRSAWRAAPAARPVPRAASASRSTDPRPPLPPKQPLDGVGSALGLRGHGHAGDSLTWRRVHHTPSCVRPPPVPVGRRARHTDRMGTLFRAGDGYEIHKVVVGPLDNNVYVLRCTQTGEAVLLDAANEHDRLLDLCRRLGVRSVLETHGHWDHIQAVPELRDAGYQVHVTAEDADMLPSYDQLLEDESVVQVGRLRLRTIHTPGHTPGSMCFLLEGAPVLFSGDTLFPGGPGATKFPGGDFEAIIESIDRKLFTLDPTTEVLPGHGDPTTIGNERPHLQEWIDRGW